MALLTYLREFTTVQVTNTDMAVLMLIMLLFTCIMFLVAVGRSFVLASIFFNSAIGYVFMVLYNFFPSHTWLVIDFDKFFNCAFNTCHLCFLLKLRVYC